jgi:hypothetical protein
LICGEVVLIEVSGTAIPLVNRQEDVTEPPLPTTSFSPTRGEKLEADHVIDV